MTVDEIAIEIEDALREDYEALCNYGTPLLAAQAAKEDVADFKAACLAQGRAEGAEQGVRKERQRLKVARETTVEGKRSINGVPYFLIPVREFSVPLAPVLAPKEEK